MALDLALMLAAIAARAIVAQLIRGEAPDTDDWASVASEVAGAVVAGASSPAPAGSALAASAGADAAAIPNFDLHMTSGRRYVHDLPDVWRTDRDRLEMTRDARHEFIQAASIAELVQDHFRQAQAELAIAGCWLWAPSLDDARKTMAKARGHLMGARTLGANPAVEQAYQEVQRLCRAYGVPDPKPVVRPTSPTWSRTDLDEALRRERAKAGISSAGRALGSGSALPSYPRVPMRHGEWAEHPLVKVRCTPSDGGTRLSGREGELMKIEAVTNSFRAVVHFAYTYEEIGVYETLASGVQFLHQVGLPYKRYKFQIDRPRRSRGGFQVAPVFAFVLPTDE